MPRRPRRNFVLPCRLAVALLTGLAGLVLSSAPASAGVGLAITPEFPAAVSAGSTGVPAALSIVNRSSGGEGDNSATVGAITLVPSCGVPPAAPPDVTCTGGEDTAFRLSPTASGAAGSACAGWAFTVSEIEPTSGRYLFTPDRPVVLGPPGSGVDACVVTFTFDVGRLPARDAFPAQANVQTTQLAYSTASFSPSALTGSGTGTDVTTVARATPSLAVEVPDTVPLGETTSATVTPSGGAAPTGTITIAVFGPDDEVCAGSPLLTWTLPVSGPGGYPSGPFTPPTPGTYRWVVSYGGDELNGPAGTGCGAPEGTTGVTKATPGLTVRVPSSAEVGQPIRARATLTGGVGTSGEIAVSLFGPGDPNCEGTPVFTSTGDVTGTGRYVSRTYAAPEPGTYRWVASYPGDDSNAAGTTACGEAASEVVLTRATEAPPAPAAPATPPTAPQAAPTTAPQATPNRPAGDLAGTGAPGAGRQTVVGGLLVALGAAALLKARRPGRTGEAGPR